VLTPTNLFLKSKSTKSTVPGVKRGESLPRTKKLKLPTCPGVGCKRHGGARWWASSRHSHPDSCVCRGIRNEKQGRSSRIGISGSLNPEGDGAMQHGGALAPS